MGHTIDIAGEEVLIATKPDEIAENARQKWPQVAGALVGILIGLPGGPIGMAIVGVAGFAIGSAVAIAMGKDIMRL